MFSKLKRGSFNGVDSPNSVSYQLQQTTLKIMNDAPVCSPIFIGYYDTTKIYCAVGNSKSNACFGDSGGPLMYYANNKWYLYGVVSYVEVKSNQNCDPTQPSFYTQVPAYLTFIGNAIANLK